jgi:hypothetical protein
MGTSVRMIERHYGTLLQGSGDAIRGKLDAYLATVEKEEEDAGADARAWIRTRTTWTRSRETATIGQARIGVQRSTKFAIHNSMSLVQHSAGIACLGVS